MTASLSYQFSRRVPEDRANALTEALAAHRRRDARVDLTSTSDHPAYRISRVLVSALAPRRPEPIAPTLGLRRRARLYARVRAARNKCALSWFSDRHTSEAFALFKLLCDAGTSC